MFRPRLESLYLSQNELRQLGIIASPDYGYHVFRIHPLLDSKCGKSSLGCSQIPLSQLDDSLQTFHSRVVPQFFCFAGRLECRIVIAKQHMHAREICVDRRRFLIQL